MADLEDVVGAVVGTLGAALFPAGVAATSPVVGAPCTVLPGWPTANQLEKALADGRVIISVFPPPNLERDTTRVMPRWQRAAPPARTLTVAVSGQAVTLGGIPAQPQWASIVTDAGSASYPVQAGDTLASAAAALATLLTAAGQPANSAGPVVTIPGAHRITARVGTVAGVAKEVERTQRAVMVTVWAPSPVLRTAAARAVRDRLARVPKFLALPDGSAAWLVYDRENLIDAAQKADLWRRDMTYWAEFGRYETADGYEVTIAQAGITPAIPPYDPLAPERVTNA